MSQYQIGEILRFSHHCHGSLLNVGPRRTANGIGVRLSEIRKAFRDTQILHGVSLDIADGEFLTLVGPSGCGKSTLLRVIAGLEQQDTGEVAIGERMLPKRAG